MSVLSSILKDTPRAVSELRDDIPKPLARMIQRALEKRPEDRYQSTTDLRRDLEDLKRDVDTGEVVLGTTAGRKRLVAEPRPAPLGAAGGDRRGDRGPRRDGRDLLRRTRARDGRGRPPLARGALLRQRHRRSASLDWLRTGLTDMLVTNLSQSPGLRVAEHAAALPDPRRGRTPRRPLDLGPGRGSPWRAGRRRRRRSSAASCARARRSASRRACRTRGAARCSPPSASRAIPTRGSSCSSTS